MFATSTFSSGAFGCHSETSAQRIFDTAFGGKRKVRTGGVIMGGIAKIFSPSKPAPVVAPPPAPTQSTAAVAAQTTQAADNAASSTSTTSGRGRAANISPGSVPASIDDQLADTTDNFSVRKKLLGN